MHARNTAKKKATQTDKAMMGPSTKECVKQLLQSKTYQVFKLHNNSGNSKDTWTIQNDLLGKKIRINTDQ